MRDYFLIERILCAYCEFRIFITFKNDNVFCICQQFAVFLFGNEKQSKNHIILLSK